MSEKKKDLSAFLKKNQKKGKKTTEATAAPVVEDKKEEVKVEAKEVKSTTQKKDESSDEEVDDELDLDSGAIKYGSIKEKKDIVVAEKQDESETKGFGFENTTSAPQVAAEKKKKDATEITFGGGRPRFGRVKKGLGAEFSEGLDDLDDDGNTKTKTKVKASEGGQREFINLGSKARSGAAAPEEKKTASFTGVKPTFKGRMNLNKDQDTGGVNTNYDFKVSYRTNDDEGKKKKAVPFGQHVANQAADDDDGFEVVKGKERKARKVQRDDSSSEEEQDVKITRGDARGARGRGGFFKNSAKN